MTCEHIDKTLDGDTDMACPICDDVQAETIGDEIEVDDEDG